MNSLLPRRSAESVCLFCRQGLLRPWRHQQQQQRQRLLAPGQPQRRRFLSGTAAVQMPPPFAQAAEQSAPSASSAQASSSSPKTAAASPYTRYSLYPEPAPPMTMRPPPPPSPVVPVESPAKTAKEALQETPKVATAATAAQHLPASRAAEEAAPEAKKDETKPAAAAATTTSAAPPAAATPRSKRPSKLRAPRKAAMRLTPAAVEQVRELLEGPEPKLIKVGVRNRGCSGLAYSLDYVEKPGAFDELVEQDGVTVLVDSKALFSIIGSEMDWVEDKLNQRFVFRNPNIKEECGCGESFMV